MFLQLAHTRLNTYSATRQFILECYRTTKLFSLDESYILTQQIPRAALSVHLNVAEGASRSSSAERKRFYEIVRSSLIEIDAALDVAMHLQYVTQEHLQALGDTIIKCFRYLTGLINSPK